MIHPFLIDTVTLEQNLGRADLVVIDVRGKAAYAFGGHIPGAVQVTWHDFSDPAAAAKALPDPDLSRSEPKIQTQGISPDSHIVINSHPLDNWCDEERT